METKEYTETKLLLPPAIDSRTLPDLINQMKEMVPFYTPEWRFSPDDPDVGTALFFIVADMLQENIKRLNQVPLQHLIAFMNLIDVSLIAAQPAHTYLTFTLNEGTEQPILVSKGTQVAANPDDGLEPVIFETDSHLLVTPAVLTALYNVDAKSDRIVLLTDNLPEASESNATLSLPFFQHQLGDNLQEHTFYIQHDDLLFIEHGAVIRLEWNNSQKRFTEKTIAQTLSNTDWVEWTYYTEEGWLPFDQVTHEAENVISLRKERLGPLAECEVAGIAGRWIRCRLYTDRPSSLEILNNDLEMDVLRMHTEYLDVTGEGDILPDTMFMNDIQLDHEGFFPFAEQFTPFTSFYLSCPEVLSKKGSLVTLSFSVKAVPVPFRTGIEPDIDWKLIMKRSDFEKKDPPKIWVQQVLWEYWNGSSWVSLDTPEKSESVFRWIYTEQTEQVEVSFRCPDDLEQTYVNSQLSHWIRLRLLTMDNIYASEMIYMAPWVEQIGLRYEYENRFYPMQRLVTYNNLEWSDRTLEARQSGTVFPPFYGVDGKHSAVYFGFDRPPLKGPISLYFALQQQKYTASEAPQVEWEYLRKQEDQLFWSGLKVLDETKGFTRSGTIQFAGPPDIATATLFGQTLCWIRAVNRDELFEQEEVAAPVVHNIFMNTIRATQQETILNEIPDFTEEEFQLSRSSVIDEEVWIDETGLLTESEVKALQAEGKYELDIIRDSSNQLQRVWVKWQQVDNFLQSGYNDRHYMINRSTGRFWFGDGTRGMVPPQVGMDKIRVNYKVSEGERGNLAAGQVNELRNSLAFINSAVNRVAAGGGANTEKLTEALLRGPEMLKHQQRAVTAEDFEWLARQIYPNIAKVKCLANYNAKIQREPGCVTLVVLSREGMAGQIFFPELKRKVEKYLLEQTASTLSFSSKVAVIEPAYLEISITVTVIVASMEEIIPTELACLEKLNQFLDPYHGQADGKGWEIGEPVHISMFYSLLKSVNSVINIERVYMTGYKIEAGKREEIDTNRLDKIPHGIVVNGQHKVTVIPR